MTRRITIDPVTRIEGHLRIDVEVDAGRVTDAWASSQMWRGIETILRGRDPRDAWVITQRFCGVCTTVHAIASIRAVESALGTAVPVNAQWIRNLMIAQHAVQDHIVHFYHLSALDWVDVVSALGADPRAAARLAETVSDWPGNSAAAFREVRERLRRFAGSGRLGPFQNGYWGHPEMRLSPEANLMAAAHYLQALEVQRKGAQAVAVLGGKNPHIQNLCVGGVATAVDPDGMAALNLERLALVRSLVEETRDFVRRVYLPDLLAIARAYPEWFRVGRGVDALLAVPEFPVDETGGAFLLPGGFFPRGGLASWQPIRRHDDGRLVRGIAESAEHSWYADPAPRHPWEGATEPVPADYDPGGKYTWCKAPRFEGVPVEVGPVAQMLAAYADGNARVRSLVDGACEALGIGPDDLHSVMGRMVARGLRAALMADLSVEFLDRLEANLAAGDREYARPAEIPAKGEFRGVGFHEAPRGMLSHWIVIEDGRIGRYQAVVPSTWNASPRDAQGRSGPYEASLVGLPVADPERPLEVLRAIHSFDPCIACAVHTLDVGGREIARVRVL
ncbi:nickel-dependent hydrogenase large subunit [Deferrisoma palaeochoriense]